MCKPIITDLVHFENQVVNKNLNDDPSKEDHVKLERQESNTHYNDNKHNILGGKNPVGTPNRAYL